jgi:hypothetical protein
MNDAGEFLLRAMAAIARTVSAVPARVSTHAATP